MGKRLSDALNAALVALMFAIAAWTISRLPAGGQVAIHWGSDGRPDSGLGQQAALLILPISALLLWFIPTFFPQGFALPRHAIQLARVQHMLLIFLVAQLLVAISFGQ